MDFAVALYDIDLVIGNILSNKELIFIKYNQKNFQQAESEIHKGNVESTIIDRILNAHKLKFGLQKQ